MHFKGEKNLPNPLSTVLLHITVRAKHAYKVRFALRFNCEGGCGAKRSRSHCFGLSAFVKAWVLPS